MLFSGRWPRSGIVSNGIAYQLPPLALRTAVTVSGSSALVPTPTAKANMLAPSMQKWPSHRNLWPTPKAKPSGPDFAKLERSSTGISLATAVALSARTTWPTPTANEDAAGTPNGKMQKMLGNHPDIRGTTPRDWAGGTLNPRWVEWLMGFPDGWTDLSNSETP